MGNNNYNNVDNNVEMMALFLVTQKLLVKLIQLWYKINLWNNNNNFDCGKCFVRVPDELFNGLKTIITWWESQQEKNCDFTFKWIGATIKLFLRPLKKKQQNCSNTEWKGRTAKKKQTNSSSKFPHLPLKHT